MEFALDTRATATSTNDIIKQAIEDGAPEGTAVRAVRQAGGYGRQGRSWSSPEGGMYLSVLLRPEVQLRELPTLSLAVGLAVRSALASLVTSDQARRIAVKWPNDVVVLAGEDAVAVNLGPNADSGVSAGREGSAQAVAVETREASLVAFNKICGISMEKHRDGICVGIGVNVLPPSPEEAAAPAASLMAAEGVPAASDVAAAPDTAGMTPSVDGPTEEGVSKNKPSYLADLGFGFICDRQSCVEEVAQAVLEQLGEYYARWQADGFASMAPEYAAQNALRAMTVAVSPMTGAPIVEGRVTGVDENGRLLIETAPETIVAVSSGEAHILKRG